MPLFMILGAVYAFVGLAVIGAGWYLVVAWREALHKWDRVVLRRSIYDEMKQ